MARLLFVLAIVIAVAMVYAIVDIITIDRFRVRGAPKAGWVAIVVLLPAIGVLLWFLLGRGRRDTRQQRVTAPDDDPNFLGNLKLDQDERIRRLEQELADLDDDPPTKD